MQSRQFPSLAALVEAASTGDARAQHELHERFNPRFGAFANYLLSRKGCCQPHQHSLDVLNAAWGNIFHSLGKGKLWSPSNFYKWGRGIVYNETNNHLGSCIEQQNFEIPIASLTRTSSDESGEREIPFEPASLVDDRTVIDNGLLADEILSVASEISPKFHAILYLQVTNDLGLKEIAGRIGESYDNTRTIYSRGIKQLRRKMAGKVNAAKKTAAERKRNKGTVEEKDETEL